MAVEKREVSGKELLNYVMQLVCNYLSLLSTKAAYTAPVPHEAVLTYTLPNGVFTADDNQIQDYLFDFAMGHIDYIRGNNVESEITINMFYALKSNN